MERPELGSPAGWWIRYANFLESKIEADNIYIDQLRLDLQLFTAAMWESIRETTARLRRQIGASISDGSLK
jgi:hypothetical protein